MRSAIFSLFRKSPFEALARHATLIREVGPLFRSAFLSYLDENHEEFESLHNEVTILESQGDAIKRNIRGHLPKGVMMPVEKFQLLWYLREQDKILDSTQDALHWLSYRRTRIPDEIVDDLLFMIEKVGDIQKSVYPLVVSADKYFRSFTQEDRQPVKKSIHQIREYESQADQIERKLLSDLFAYPFESSTSTFHLVRLVEYLGQVPNHAENASDMMRAMIAR